MTPMNERDDTTGTGPQCYHHTRTVEIAGRTVRAHVERGYYLDTSRAVAEVLSDHATWSNLAADAPNNWLHNTPKPGPDIDDPARFLSPVVERLLQRAAAILATTSTVSLRLHGTVSALLVTSCGDEAECRLEPGEHAWVYTSTYSGALRITELPDGSVTFSKARRVDCPFITSQGELECDEGRLLPALSPRRP